MQNIVLDLMTWSKLFKSEAHKITSIEAKENLTGVGKKLDDIVDCLITGKDGMGEKITPEQVGQILLKLWRVTNSQDWQFSTLTVLGDEATQVALSLSFIRDTAENLLRRDYIVPDKPLHKEDIKKLMNPIGVCPHCSKVGEIRGGFCPFCKKAVNPDDIQDFMGDEYQGEQEKEEIVDYDSLAPSTIFKLNVANNLYECINCGYSPFAQGETRDEKCRDVHQCTKCGKKEDRKGVLPFVSRKKAKAKIASLFKDEPQIEVEKEKTEPDLYRGTAWKTWGCYAGSEGRMGKSIYDGPTRGKIKWTANLGMEQKSAPVVAPNGDIVIGTMSGGIFGYTQEGKTKWLFKLNDIVVPPATVDEQGAIYFTTPKKLFRLNPDGTPDWSLRLGTLFAPALSKHGNLFLVSGNELHCVSYRGKLRWSYNLGPQVRGGEFDLTVAVGPEGNVYVAADSLHGISHEGRIIFQVKLIKRGTHPMVDPQGNVYLGTENMIYAINPKGKRLWDHETRDIIKSPPVMDDKGNIFFATDKFNFIMSIDSKGGKNWEFRASSPIVTCLGVTNIGNILFGTQDGKLICLNAKGQEQWHVKTKKPGAIFTYSPAIIDKGAFVTSSDGKLMLIE